MSDWIDYMGTSSSSYFSYYTYDSYSNSIIFNNGDKISLDDIIRTIIKKEEPKKLELENISIKL